MRKGSSSSLTAEQQDELAALQALPEEQINTLDIPEQRDWTNARRGAFYRPLKKQITLRLDADIIEWFRNHPARGEGYQTSINRALREYVATRDRK